MKALLATLVVFTTATANPAWAEDWSGAYGGFSFGYTDADSSGNLGGDSAGFGGHVGYDYDFGEFVLGGELEYNWLSLDLGNAGGELDGVSSLKFRGGYEFGPTLGYIVLGASRANGSADSDTAAVYGIGVAYPISDRFVISGEALRQEFDNLNGQSSGTDVNTFNLRTTFRF
ncbi:MAG: outer membrane protein [Ruegeria sp.]